MHRNLLLLTAAIALTACAHAPRAGGPASSLVGALVLEGTEQPIVGAKLTLTPLEPLDDRDGGETLGIATGYTEELGAFVFDDLRRDYAYELRADANGFYSTVERVEVGKGQNVMLLEIEVIEPETFAAEPIQELNPDALETEPGSLIELVLDRMGR